MELNIHPLFDFETVDFNKESDVHLDVVLEAPKKKDDKRIPLHLILAADCSGSMMGGKLQSVKRTMEKLVDNLVEDDTIGIIGFSSTVWEALPVLPMTVENKKIAKNAIGGLQTLGSTNLSEAITLASEKAVISDKDKICRVVLLTDGLPTCGECSTEKLVEQVGLMSQRVSMTAFGFGADYDPELLASLASMGRGNNFYIQNDDDCRNAFALELGGLLSLMAQDIKVILSFSDIMTVHDFLSDYKISQSSGYRGLKGPRIELTIDDIYYGEKKHMVVKLNVPSASEAVCARPTRVCGISISYLEVESNQRQSQEGVARIQYTKTPQKDPNDEVRKQLVMIEAANVQKKAKEKADQGDYVGARNVLHDGLVWIDANSWYEGAPAIQQSFQTLSTNCSDRFTYRSKGQKMARAYFSSYTTGRGASGQTLSTSYATEDQLKMMESFCDDNTIKAKISSLEPEHDSGNDESD